MCMFAVCNSESEVQTVQVILKRTIDYHQSRSFILRRVADLCAQAVI